ncbi:serine/threonine-protein kinase ATG1c-like isoform X1 [Nicotiana tabacum]|uniref:Serine/threonine-protein kinase ATG1c-like isoform X1 n=2 Tax=Nicotiana TaxID=4085 RepID=A0A1S4AG40_TOBAC|nr:PREDICTED: serine/threonine-protein kinase ATG1 isoform X2 [Nicotiana sylvestris]XP_016475647.1 PREDICTED: serine/threonine-protein kinase ATG1c-like isoform X2 [Nicotiana tabacum]
MAQSMSRGGGRSVVGNYVVGKQIGAGSFSTVWHARHRAHGTEVAIKEIVTARLNNKLQDSLKSEIVILQKINHPNIIRLHDMIEEVGKIYIILEYCRGGDLSMYIQQRQGRIPEATAKHFMQQLASGLKILRDNNLIHRDLKPQNLLLSSNDDSSTLKIADFGFARSLQPRGLAETLCGSPLYMAPEIMQLQKYDAKADLWSVGAILFQLVTGKTPFTGNNQIQLLQNILKSTELLFPPNAKNLSSNCIELCKKLLRRNPVERLTFEEFFNHPFLAEKQPDKLSWDRRPQRVIGGFPISEGYPVRNREETFQEDGLPFSLDDDSSVPDGTPSFAGRLPQRLSHGFSYDAKAERKEGSSNTPLKTDSIGSSHRHTEGNLRESINLKDHRQATTRSKVVDSFELIDQDYVIVSGPPMDSYSSAGASRLSNMPFRSSSSLQASAILDPRPSDPVPIIGPPTSRIDHLGSLESPSSAPGSSQGCTDIINRLEQPPTDGMARIESLQHFASAIMELVNEKVEASRHLEAFSIQLVSLAIWKQALDICHTQAASAIEGSPNQETIRLREIMKKGQASLNIKKHLDATNILGPENVCSHIEKAFLSEVGNAEELAKHIEPGNSVVPDAMEMIFQSALALGRKGAVDEYMGRTENAVVFYSKAVRLLKFLQVEAPSLILNPPFSLTNSDRYRLQNYIDVLNNRQSVSRSQMMALLKCEDQHCSP